MTQTGIHLFQLLKPKLGERETEALINFVDLKSKENKQEIQESNLKTCAAKEDLWKVKDELKGSIANFRTELKENISGLRTELKEDISGLRTELKEDIFNLRTELKGNIAGLRTELKGDIAGLRTELKGDIAGLRIESKGNMASLDIKISDFKSDIIRWVFAFFVTLMLAIIGLYFKH